MREKINVIKSDIKLEKPDIQLKKIVYFKIVSILAMKGMMVTIVRFLIITLFNSITFSIMLLL
jgi:hypothetical protein